MARTRIGYSDRGLTLRQLPASALKACFKEGFTAQQLRNDFTAGVLVGVVALPLAMALSIAIGLPPQHGLYTAMIAGFVTALLGGSRLNIVGPTAAFVVILGPIVQTFGLPGFLLSGVMAGVLLMGMGLLRMGKLIEFIPFPVTTGFTTGIALVIAGLQIKDVLGLKGEFKAVHFPEKLYELWLARGSFSWGELFVALLTLGLLLVARMPQRVRRFVPEFIVRIPGPLLALPLAAFVAVLLEKMVPSLNIVTLGERFSTVTNGTLVAGIPRTLPVFQWPWEMVSPSGQVFELSFNTVRTLLPSAITVAILGAIESLLSAVVADGMARTRHEPDSELFALGVANVLTPFFGGIPATGAIARTASNYRFGGRTPLAAMTHAVTVLLAVLVLAPLLSYLPMASMASLLLLVAWNMSEIEHFIHTLRVAPKSDKAVLLICFFLTVIFDMVVAVTVGVALGALFFVRKMAKLTRGTFLDPAQIRSIKYAWPADVVVYAINGPLFFGAAERAIGALRSIGRDVRVVVFLLNEVLDADMTGLVAIESVISEINARGTKVILVGVKKNVREIFSKGGLKPQDTKLIYVENLSQAMDEMKSSTTLSSQSLYSRGSQVERH